MSIPKVIHYCWFGGKEKSDNINYYISSWKKYCTNYEFIEWNEENFDINCNDYVREAYQCEKWAFVTDYVRLYVLNKYGGVYMDTDVELLKNIDNFLRHKSFSGFESNNFIPTAIMGAEKGNPWIKMLLSFYEKKHFLKEDGSMDLTTNVVTITNMTKEIYNLQLNNTLQETNGDVIFYPNDFFCPKDYSTGKIIITDNTYAIHHFESSWLSNEEKILEEKKRKFMKKFGYIMGTKAFLIYYYLYKIKNRGLRYCINRLIYKDSDC